MEAHAKINLRLRVFPPDITGFHAVETILARTSLSDTVSLEWGQPSSSGSTQIMVDGPYADSVPEGPENLCCRSADAFVERAFGSSRPDLRIRLTKNIPVGAGLGGGSADAAATLRLLARRWPRLEESDLVAIAGEIGTDVPFCLLGAPMALGWERGRRLLPLRAPRVRPTLLLCPPFPVSTADAYGWLGRNASDVVSASILPGATRLSSWPSLERIARNDFESPVIDRHPDLGRVLHCLRTETEAGIAAMSGSGSVLFATFPNTDARAAARDRLQGLGGLEEWLLLNVRAPI